jgi:hypothetical protein
LVEGVKEGMNLGDIVNKMTGRTRESCRERIS